MIVYALWQPFESLFGEAALFELGFEDETAVGNDTLARLQAVNDFNRLRRLLAKLHFAAL